MMSVRPARSEPHRLPLLYSGVGRGHRQYRPGDASDRRSVPGAAWLPVEEALRIPACEAQFQNLSGSLPADIGDEIPPSRRVRQHGNLVVRQSVQLYIRVRRLAVVAWVEPGRLGTLRGFVFHVVHSSSAAKSNRILAPIPALFEHPFWSWFSQVCDCVVNDRSV